MTAAEMYLIHLLDVEVRSAGWLRRRWLKLWVTGKVRAMKAVFSRVVYVDGATPEQLKTERELAPLYFHEKCHVWQDMRDGGDDFRKNYSTDFIRGFLKYGNCRRAYAKVGYEQEARAATREYRRTYRV